MSTVTENDLRDLKDLINNGFRDLNSRIDKVDNSLVNLETRMTNVETKITNVEKNLIQLDKSQAKVETRLEDWKPLIDKVPDFAEKLGESKNWRQIVFVLLTTILGGITGWFIKASLN